MRLSRHRIRGAVSDPSPPFELLEFEQVPAGTRTVLLRLAARPSERVAIESLTLLIAGDGDPARLEPLPAPPGPADVVRVAFSAAADLVGRGTGYALELADGSIVELPAPARRQAGRRPARPVTPRAVELPDGPRLIESERRAASRRLAIVELQRRLSAEHARRMAAEAEARTARASATAEAAAVVEMRTRLAEVEAEAQRTALELDELRRKSTEQAEAAALAERLGELEAAAALSDDRRAEALAELEETLTTLAQVRDSLADRESQLAAVTTELEDVRASSASAAEAVSAETEALRAQLVELELRLEDEQVQLEAVDTEGQAGREQVAEMEIELASVKAAAEDVAGALADRVTEIELLREAAVAREHELTQAQGAQDRELAGRYEELAARYEQLQAQLADSDARLGESERAGVEAQGQANDRAAEAELARAAGLGLERELEQAWAELAAAHDALVLRDAEVELLRVAASEPREQAGAERELATVPQQPASAERELATVREQLASAEAARTSLQQRLDQAIAEQHFPRDIEDYAREVVELRGAVERAQNRARLHRQHSGELESKLERATQELASLREQVAAADGLGSDSGAATEDELETLRGQVAYHEALAADLEWQLDEARATEEVAETALAIRAAEVELLAVALREQISGATDGSG